MQAAPDATEMPALIPPAEEEGGGGGWGRGGGGGGGGGGGCGREEGYRYTYALRVH